MLSMENYDLGKSVNEFIVKFLKANSNIEDASKLIPKQMEEVTAIIDDCVYTFQCTFNLGKSKTEKILLFCRPGIEKFIFNKIYPLMYELYCKKYEDDNRHFLISQNEIKAKLSPEKIMENLEIKRKFRESEGNVKRIPFDYTIDSINKIEYEKTPKEKLDTLLKASLEMKNTILSLTNGKVVFLINFSMSLIQWMMNCR